MKYLIAPDKFKGTLSAGEVASALALGIRDSGNDAVELPVADGGDGTAEVLLSARGGEWVEIPSVDAIGRPVDARFAMLPGGTAVVEVAAASGMWRLQKEELSATAASSRGTGILMRHALELGAERLIVAPGGSATTDGGAGILDELGPGRIRAEIVVVCDITATFSDAARIFSPQKGASPDEIEPLVRRLAKAARNWPRNPEGVAMTGCGGGISGALWSNFNATLVPGAAYVLDALDFDGHVSRADAVLTGEGRIDAQTLLDKAVAIVTRRARNGGRPCSAIVGSRDLDEKARLALGLESIRVAGTREEIRGAALEIASERITSWK